jgi:glucose/arabinose dehydrogenase
MKRVLAVLLACTVVVATASAQPKSTNKRVASQEKDAISPDQVLGKSFQVKPEELPQPKATKAVSNGPLKLPFEGQTPNVPDGFTATLFAKLEHPRRLLVLPNGDVIVAEQKPGHLTFLRGGPDGKAEFIERHAEGFNQPYGLAWRDGHILVADQDGFWQVPHKIGDGRTGHGEDKKAADVPPQDRKPSFNFNGQSMLTQKGVFGIARGHANRPLTIDPKSGALKNGSGRKVRTASMRLQSDCRKHGPHIRR